MGKMRYAIYIILACALTACGTTKKVVHKAEVHDSVAVVKETTQTDSVVKTIATHAADSEETWVYELVEYDTHVTDSVTGLHPVRSVIRASWQQKKRESDTAEVQKETRMEAAVEQHTTIRKAKREDREVATTETKQAEYFSHVFYGIALLVFVLIIAYLIRKRCL